MARVTATAMPDRKQKEPNIPRYSDALGAYVDAHKGAVFDATLADPGRRYLLVESDRDGRRLHLSTHRTPADAARYHGGQPHPEDWPANELVDLATGVAVPHSWGAARSAPGLRPGRHNNEEGNRAAHP